MMPLPYSNTLAATVLWGLCALFALGELVVTVRSRQRGSNERGGADRKAKVAAVTLIATALLAAFVSAITLPRFTIASVPIARWTVYLLGIVALASGIALRQWSIRALGRFFTLDVRTEDDQPVVDTGPYRLVSHPSYTGAIATYLGIGLALGNWLSLLLVLAPIPAYLRRIKVEERELGEQLGQPYREYLSTHRRLLPGIW